MVWFLPGERLPYINDVQVDGLLWHVNNPVLFEPRYDMASNFILLARLSEAGARNLNLPGAFLRNGSHFQFIGMIIL